MKTVEIPDTKNSFEGRIHKALKPLNPDIVILFGSRSSGNENSESDVDLVVVLPEDSVPANFRERMELVSAVRNALISLNREYAFDLLVYTRPQWNQFLARQSWFAKEIQDKGLRIA